MPKTSVSDFHKQIQISPGFPLLYCVPKINVTFYVLNEMQKNFPNRQSALSLPLCLFLEGGGGVLSNILGYKWGWSTEKFSDEERVIIESYPSNPTSLPFHIKNERSLRTCCCLYCVTKKKVVVLTYGGNLFVQGEEKAEISFAKGCGDRTRCIIDI